MEPTDVPVTLTVPYLGNGGKRQSRSTRRGEPIGRRRRLPGVTGRRRRLSGVTGRRRRLSGVAGRRRRLGEDSPFVVALRLVPESVFSRLPVSLKLLSLPRRALATKIMAAIATSRRIKIVTRMFNELQRFDLDETRAKTSV